MECYWKHLLRCSPFKEIRQENFCLPQRDQKMKFLFIFVLLATSLKLGQPRPLIFEASPDIMDLQLEAFNANPCPSGGAPLEIGENFFACADVNEITFERPTRNHRPN
ncbi:unnamed protein product [Allacma fusca]|uniref:Uncharacterized protein n=1 Tax=Allacma fusca TaxID=39272 RepID=A0A8J2KJ24_9HEXA|nr:unnamed protein product [Allacma fusca]